MILDINDYNSYEKLDTLPYNIMVYLLENNDELWKLLYYNTSDVLMQPNLTIGQKQSLIYDGSEDATPFRVFFNALVSDDITSVQCAMLRMFIYDITPRDRIISDVTFEFDLLSHTKIIQLGNHYYSTRTLKLMQNILSTLNGKDIGGVGKLSFDKKGNMLDKATFGLSNAHNFEGYYVRMSCHWGAS